MSTWKKVSQCNEWWIPKFQLHRSKGPNQLSFSQLEVPPLEALVRILNNDICPCHDNNSNDSRNKFNNSNGDVNNSSVGANNGDGYAHLQKLCDFDCKIGNYDYEDDAKETGIFSGRPSLSSSPSSSSGVSSSRATSESDVRSPTTSEGEKTVRECFFVVI